MESPSNLRLQRIRNWLERIEKERMPVPVHVLAKGVFEYEIVDVKAVAFLKAVRAAQSLHSLELLCSRGLFYDFYTVIRCICECVDQIYFLLETYPRTSKHVDQFVSHFARTTIENAKVQDGHGVRQDLIHSTVARARHRIQSSSKGVFGEKEKQAKQLLNNIWVATCQSVHSNYADVMQCYGGPPGLQRFQLEGVPSAKMREMNAQWIPEAISSVTGVFLFIAEQFELDDLAQEIKKEWLTE